MNYIESLLGRDEIVLFETRQHTIVIARHLFLYGVILVLIIAASIALARGTSEQAWFALLVVAVPVLLRLILVLMNWWNERYIITNRRVIQIAGVVNKQVSDSSLDKVNDVVMEQSVLGRILDYGDIRIITGSDIGVNDLERIAGPRTFKRAMLDAKAGIDQEGESVRALDAGGDDIPALIERLAHLHEQGILSEEEFEQKKAELLSRL